MHVPDQCLPHSKANGPRTRDASCQRLERRLCVHLRSWPLAHVRATRTGGERPDNSRGRRLAEAMAPKAEVWVLPRLPGDAPNAVARRTLRSLGTSGFGEGRLRPRRSEPIQKPKQTPLALTTFAEGAHANGGAKTRDGPKTEYPSSLNTSPMLIASRCFLHRSASELDCSTLLQSC